MTYTNGTMTLPKKAVVMEREEMRYVEGGDWSSKTMIKNIKGLKDSIPTNLFRAVGLTSYATCLAKATYYSAAAWIGSKMTLLGRLAGGVIGFLIASVIALGACYVLGTRRIFH